MQQGEEESGMASLIKCHYKQKHEGDGMVHGKCKGPEAEVWMAFSRNSKASSVAGAK